MVIGDYYINGYWWILKIIYWWLLMVIILMAIGDYSINDYCEYFIMNIGGY